MNNPLVDIIKEDVARFIDRIDFSELHKKKVLLTGASGIVGTYFLATLAHLRSAGVFPEVVAVMQSPFPSYLEPFAEGVRFMRCDITDQVSRADLPQADYIIHAAGYGQPGKFMQDPLKTIELNTSVTIDLLRRLSPGGKFLFLSTSEVYSGLPQPPYNETQIGTTNTTHPRSCYIEGKRCGEAIVQAARDLGIQAKSARLSLAYGPGTRIGDARVINTFIYRGIKERRITLLDQGKAGRTYGYVADAVEIMWHILLRGRDSVYNVGGTSRTTIGDLAIKIGLYLEVPVDIPEEESSGLVGAPQDVSLDLSKIADEFNKTEFISLNEGVSRTIEWQKALYNQESSIV